MAEPNSDAARKRVRRIGTATLATLCSQIGLGLVGYFAVAAHRPSPIHGLGSEFIAWMACVFILGVMLCVLVVVYLRAAFRDNAAATSKVLWTLLIIGFGPFGMVCYWTVHMRRLHGMA